LLDDVTGQVSFKLTKLEWISLDNNKINGIEPLESLRKIAKANLAKIFLTWVITKSKEIDSIENLKKKTRNTLPTQQIK
jgi:hypothetical protein